MAWLRTLPATYTTSVTGPLNSAEADACSSFMIRARSAGLAGQFEVVEGAPNLSTGATASAGEVELAEAGVRIVLQGGQHRSPEIAPEVRPRDQARIVAHQPRRRPQGVVLY